MTISLSGRTPSELARLVRPCVVCITVKTPEGDLANGTGFHIGGGAIVTARHVVDGNTLVSVVGAGYGPTDVQVSGTHFPDDSKIDLALLTSDFSLHHYMELTRIIAVSDEGPVDLDKIDRIPLGGHLDDWVGHEFLLSKAYAFGFPIIPKSSATVLTVVEASVNAIVDRYDGPHPHFIVSSIPRGGFSGGPVISEWGFLLGVMTGALYDGGKPAEVGFSAVLSIEPLLELVLRVEPDCGENLKLARDLLKGLGDAEDDESPCDSQ